MRYSSYIAAAAALPTLSLATPSSPKGHGKVQKTKITVQPDEKHQLIEGFGFSGAFQRAQLLLNVTEQVQQELFDLIYSTETGVGFSMVRNGIGSSNSSFNDLMNSHLPFSPGSPDAEPEYVWDEYDSGQLALSIKAVEYGVKRFYANAWSSPGFMKNNSDDANGGLLCGVEGSFEEGTQCKYDWRQAYADYFVKYIRLYASHGVNVTEVGFLNEPDLTTPYASMRSDAQQTADFLPVLHDTLEREGLGHVGIACCEHTGWHETAENIAGLQELGAEKYLSHVTSHEYSGNISYQLDTDRRVWQTEYCDLSNDWNPRWDGVNRGDGWRWAFILHKALTVGNVNAYYWYVSQTHPYVLLCVDCSITYTDQAFSGGSSSKTATQTTTKTKSSSRSRTASTKSPNAHGLSRISPATSGPTPTVSASATTTTSSAPLTSTRMARTWWWCLTRAMKKERLVSIWVNALA
jgi:O-glycosyl hydrolase